MKKNNNNVVLKGVKLDSIVSQFNWTYQNRKIPGCRVKLLGELYIEEFKESRETSIYVTVFNEKVTKLFVSSEGKELTFNCEGYLNYKRVTSNKFINKYDKEPAVYGILDIILQTARIAGPAKVAEKPPIQSKEPTSSDEETDSQQDALTLEEIFT